MNKTEKDSLDEEYDDRLLEIQKKCNHVISHFAIGRFGCVTYGECDLCEAQIQFQVRLNKDENGSVVLLSAERLGSSLYLFVPVVFDRFGEGKYLSNFEIEKWYKEIKKFGKMVEITHTIEDLIKNKPMSEWKDLLALK